MRRGNLGLLRSHATIQGAALGGRGRICDKDRKPTPHAPTWQVGGSGEKWCRSGAFFPLNDHDFRHGLPETGRTLPLKPSGSMPEGLRILLA